MFVHLRTHTEYSVVDGILRIEPLLQAAAADAQGALAITDLGNLFGTVKFYKEARSLGIKPLIGADVWLEGLPGPQGAGVPSRLLLLVQNHQGYLHLCDLLARGWTQNEHKAQAHLKWAWLDELNGGLLALSGADQGAIGQALLAGDLAKADQAAMTLAKCFPNRFYLECQRAGRAFDERLA